ncbi:MAG: bifunctional diaminohydroxyphosphoribosylaminopyrimidine deaminase/5-amino-6-(5-phosphoribosylamino)uracil reductase RibD [Emcibacter sp.]|nr:bifunctional diaminohydroxyphosphoribosylaminopyrimidine deaminase/5-amino-6-(5-phosphoribosylamino)uracil reductase RibD [Emcibacter sp.]
MRKDSNYMKMALGLPRRGLGVTWPNPAVGCVIIDGLGHVVGRGFTGRGGRPHAETQALAQAGDAAQGAVAYVTLEPCAHHGKTPPCAESLIKAKVGRVVVATGDPDSRVSGRGLKMLEQAGIQVDFGVCQTEAKQVNQGFFQKISQKKPLVTIKIASSLDGKTATASGQSKWITGSESRQRGHLLRANHDAIMVGVGTVMADDPSLDCRLPGLEDWSPVRIIVDSHLTMPESCKLLETAKKIPTWVVTTTSDGPKFEALKNKGAKLITCAANKEGRVDLTRMMELLAEEGITRLLCEGGAQVNASLIRASLVDRLYWFRSSGVIGGDGLSALGSTGLDELKKMPNFVHVRTGQTGNDIWQEFII